MVLNIQPISSQLREGKNAANKRKLDYIYHQKQRVVQRKNMKSGSPSRDCETVSRAYSGAESLGSGNVPEPNPNGNRALVMGKDDRRNSMSDRGDSLMAYKINSVLSKFCALVRQLEQQQEGIGERREILHRKAADILKPYRKQLLKDRGFIGHVPGIEVGQEFQSRIMLNILGLHRHLQGGIDFLKAEETTERVPLASSIVVSGGYEDNIDNGDVLIYTGQGGNDYEKSKKQVFDQSLIRGNRALVNSHKYRKSVRVFRSCQTSAGAMTSVHKAYRYDGLYRVERWCSQTGESGFWVYKFWLRREEGQPPLACGVVSFVRNSQGKNVAVIKEDIAEGRHNFRIRVVNSVDNVHIVEKFNYCLTVKYPHWVPKLELPSGCRCVGGCTDSKECLCASRNGGEFAYSPNGILAKAQPVVYECGPTCRCPPTCRNRVSQHGLKHKLEVFRTRRKDWGVRTLEFLEAGSFVTEYTGELTAYPSSANNMMFPISSIAMKGNWGDLGDIMVGEAMPSFPSQVVEDLGFHVDASNRGNVSRFINRNSRPNLFAQYVLYDHHDIRIPHVMFFALENISPQLELSISWTMEQNANKQFGANKRCSGTAKISSQRSKYC